MFRFCFDICFFFRLFVSLFSTEETQARILKDKEFDLIKFQSLFFNIASLWDGAAAGTTSSLRPTPRLRR